MVSVEACQPWLWYPSSHTRGLRYRCAMDEPTLFLITSAEVPGVSNPGAVYQRIDRI